MPGSERQRFLKDIDLESFTDKTIIEPGDLDRQLNIVKARGYAISLGKQHDDVSAAAAAILDHRARPIAAINTEPGRGRL